MIDVHGSFVEAFHSKNSLIQQEAAAAINSSVGGSCLAGQRDPRERRARRLCLDSGFRSSFNETTRKRVGGVGGKITVRLATRGFYSEPRW